MQPYGYAPPPPPPVSGAGGHQPQSYPPRGSSGPPRGRGNHQNGGRGNFRGAQQVPQYDYSAQHSYPQHNIPYAGAQPPPTGSYPAPHQPQWQPSHASHHVHVQAHAPVPLSSANYHPNYSHQSYPTAQYPPQQPQYGAPQQYGYQPPPNPQPQWNSQAHSPPAGYGAAPSRGGYSGHAATAAYPSAPRPGNEHDPKWGYNGQPYPQDGGAVHFTGPKAPYPPPSSNAHHSQGPRHGRGRGGSPRGGGGRGRGSNNNHGDRARHQNKGPQGGNNGSAGQSKQHDESQPSKKKRKTNTLGLTPGDEATAGDLDDEQAFENMSEEQKEKIQSMVVTDIAAFLADRRKNFPTKARVDAAKAAQAARKEEEKTSRLEKQADKLRKQLRKVESSIKRKRDQGDEGDEMRDSPDDSSTDEGPEEMTARSPAAAQSPPPPAKKADVSRHCKYYSTGGTCGKKSKCRFVHDPEVRQASMKEVEANSGRPTVRQALELNEKDQEDSVILESIEAIRRKGVLDLPMQRLKVDEKKPALVSQRTSLLPAAPPSLPPPPPKREHLSNNHHSQRKPESHENWLSKSLGSSSGKQAKSNDLP